MGRINFIWNSKDWKIDIEGINKNIPNDIVYRMIIGCGYYEEYYEIYEFISKDNYENIVNNNYKILTFPYSVIPILLFDEKGNCIPLVKDRKIEYDSLSSYQKRILKR